ncbi:hypothetical protein XCV1416 [Xanthomonas euvesicatoria pv. vesicatoria str. 85-10]|uniref:Uncharacterized protein n=1 Tax=Xanthomonas euvesicatoria pv. vesicatoria (strain 85-10) TaxID=316273 RepID=Q3BVR6_XANE5|nr:hypothetical protein XCV1416 [Xanthomonas euvesicatoria pv. vesicatoria str. 85-10]
MMQGDECRARMATGKKLDANNARPGARRRCAGCRQRSAWQSPSGRMASGAHARPVAAYRPTAGMQCIGVTHGNRTVPAGRCGRLVSG